MRGASAIDAVLKEKPELPVAAFVVWERVLLTDRAGPRERARTSLTDRRIVQFWDPQRRLSEQMGGPGRFVAGPGVRILFDMGEVLWDLVLVYPPGAQWDGGRVTPRFAGGQVLNVVEDLRAHLAAFH